MAEFLNRFQNWLIKRRDFIFAWMSSDQEESSEPQASLEELPPDIAEKLIEFSNQLPTHRADRQAIKSALETALENWQTKSKTSSNCLVVLSSPIGTVSRILNESLQDWLSEIDLPVKMLDWVERPADPEQIKTKLQHQLGRGLVHPQSRSEIVIIPNLSWCFLRCVEGLEGIDYLRDVLLEDCSRFWIIGCGQVGWEYLDHVSSLKAYCGQTLVLPELDGEQLQDWLQPLIDRFNIEIKIDSDSDNGEKHKAKTHFFPRLNKISEDVNHAIDHNGDVSQTTQERYFKRLAKNSEGVSTVAVQLFLETICCVPQSESHSSIELVTKNPRLPKLSDLEAADHYILYSLLMHGDLTLNALANSLGDDASIVQSRVQRLRRQGVVEQQQQTLKVNPIHYPRIKEALVNNNFIIKEID